MVRDTEASCIRVQYELAPSHCTINKAPYIVSCPATATRVINLIIQKLSTCVHPTRDAVWSSGAYLTLRTSQPMADGTYSHWDMVTCDTLVGRRALCVRKTCSIKNVPKGKKFIKILRIKWVRHVWSTHCVRTLLSYFIWAVFRK